MARGSAASAPPSSTGRRSGIHGDEGGVIVGDEFEGYVPGIRAKLRRKKQEIVIDMFGDEHPEACAEMHIRWPDRRPLRDSDILPAASDSWDYLARSHEDEAEVEDGDERPPRSPTGVKHGKVTRGMRREMGGAEERSPGQTGHVRPVPR